MSSSKPENLSLAAIYDDGFKYPSWDVKYNRPIVDGKVTNPITGEVETAGPMLTAGPPMVDVFWMNKSYISLGGSTTSDNSVPVWRELSLSLKGTVSEVLCEIAEHVRLGVYSIWSLNATLYGVTVVCESESSKDMFYAATQAARAKMAETDESSPNNPKRERERERAQVVGGGDVNKEASHGKAE